MCYFLTTDQKYSGLITLYFECVCYTAQNWHDGLTPNTLTPNYLSQAQLLLFHLSTIVYLTPWARDLYFQLNRELCLLKVHVVEVAISHSASSSYSMSGDLSQCKIFPMFMTIPLSSNPVSRDNERCLHNAAVPLILELYSRDHITPALKKLHRLTAACGLYVTQLSAFNGAPCKLNFGPAAKYQTDCVPLFRSQSRSVQLCERSGLQAMPVIAQNSDSLEPPLGTDQVNTQRTMAYTVFKQYPKTILYL